MVREHQSMLLLVSGPCADALYPRPSLLVVRGPVSGALYTKDRASTKLVGPVPLRSRGEAIPTSDPTAQILPGFGES